MSVLGNAVERGYEDSPFDSQTIHTNGYNKTLIVNTGPTLLIGFSVYNSNVASQFIQLFDGTAAPASGSQPAALFSVSAASDKGVYYGRKGRPFLNGCVIVISSTGPTYTAAAANDCYIDAQYVAH